MKIRRILKGLSIFLVVIVFLFAILVLVAIRSEHGKILVPVKHTSRFESDNISFFPTRLQAQGNQIINAVGTPVLLKGLMPPDPAKLHSKNRFNHDFFIKISETGANVIRIPVHPENWVRDRDYLWRYLDPIVAWAGELGMYVIIDWHYIGNVATGAGPQMPDLDVQPKELTLEFWQRTANYFQDTPNVIFEIFNEPQNITARDWHSNAMEIVQVIRDQGADQLVIVGGIDYGKDLSWVRENPIADDNIAYAAHIYPAHPSYLWSHLFGEVAEIYPVLITEWGFMDENRNTTQLYLAGDRATYGEPLLEYLDTHHIGWVACWYDNDWRPPIFTQDWKDYTRYGEFVINKLKTSRK
jgi:hypothetical protein